MAHLRERVAEFSQLIKQGETILAMERFYADHIEMRENEEAPRRGKAKCIEHERDNLAKVSDFQLQILNQAINEESGTVFTETELSFKTPKGQSMLLREVSVQRWVNVWIEEEQFYYKTIQVVQ
ncbi:MAG: hypothetical protein AAF985_01710 [Bacteroidota bacterium]